MLTPAEAKKIKSYPEWDKLESHFKDSIRALDSVSDILDDEDHDKVARGKKYAVELLKVILEPFEIEDIVDEDLRRESLIKLGLLEEDE